MIPRSFHILTFGCQMNVNDSAWLARALIAHGFMQASTDEAQIILVNTCSVREKPEQKVLSTLGQIRQKRKDDVIVGVMGCVAQQMGETLFDHSPQVRLVAGGDATASIPQTIERLCNDTGLRTSLLDFSDYYMEREAGADMPSPPVAYVNIMQGCDNFCAYCIVPYTRGRQKSRATDAILDECRTRLQQGAREICLLGQNVNAFGQDKHGDGTSFASLLEKVATLSGLARLRYTSPHPKDMGKADIAAFGSLATLCPSLHLPLQSGSDKVLKRMGRKYGRQEYLDLVGQLRATRPDIALSTDIIVGFPGEEEEDFQDTLSIMKACQFVSSYSFCYSDRPGTRASRFLDKIPHEQQQARLLKLQELQEELSQKWLNTRVGEQTNVLIEGKSPKQNEQNNSWQGRDEYGAVVHLALESGHEHTGQLLKAHITDAKKHSLLATTLGEA